MPTVDKILNDFGVKLLNDVKKQLGDNHVVFGGGQDSKLAATAKYEIKKLASGIEFNFKMLKEWYWVNNGRKPGKVSKEGRGLIADWLKRKAIIGKFQTKNLEDRQVRQNESKSKQYSFSTKKYKKLKKLPFDKATKALTFLVARKVTLKGYKANHFFDKVMNDGRKALLNKAVAEQTKKDFLLDFQITSK